MNTVLPVELWDRIFTFCDIKTVTEGRFLQSEYFQENTKFAKISDAARDGNIKNIEWLLSYGQELTEDHFTEAVESGNLEMMKWFYNKGCPIGINKDNSIYIAVKQHKLENVKWLHEIGYSLTICDCRRRIDFINSDHNEDDEEFIEFDFCECDNSLISYAAKVGTVEIMEWLVSKGVEFVYYTFPNAALGGNLDTLKFLKENDCESDEYTYKQAVVNGNRANLEWLEDNGFPFDSGCYEAAIENNDLDTMKWLHQKGLKFDYYTFMKAALRGNFEIMKWLLETDCPVNSQVFNISVGAGDLEIVKWMKENNFPYDHQVLNYAILNCKGNHEIADYLHEQGIYKDVDLWETVYRRWDVEAAKWLVKNGYSYNKRQYMRMLRNE